MRGFETINPTIACWNSDAAALITTNGHVDTKSQLVISEGQPVPLSPFTYLRNANQCCRAGARTTSRPTLSPRVMNGSRGAGVGKWCHGVGVVGGRGGVSSFTRVHQ